MSQMITKKPFRSILASLVISAGFILGGESPARAAVTFYSVNLSQLGLDNYDSDFQGFGQIVSNFDLGAVAPQLAGIRVSVVTSAYLDHIDARAYGIRVGGVLQPAVSGGPTQWSFNFDKPVYGRQYAAAQTFNSGELTTFSGQGALTPLSAGAWNPNLILTASSIYNPTGTAIAQPFAFEGSAPELSFGYLQQDLLGGFSGQVINFQVGLDLDQPRQQMIPEPSRSLIILLSLGVMGLKRRRRFTVA